MKLGTKQWKNLYNIEHMSGEKPF